VRSRAPRADAAASLGVSEAELVAAGCGETATRLKGPWGQLVAGLQAVEPVMALTRNEYAVHEKHGTYNNVSMSGNSGLVLDPDIDLRIFYDRWHHGSPSPRKPAAAAPQPAVFR
jgi:putative hemin transport protein